jgi:hypothetical protein
MFTKRLLGITALAAVVILGVVGVDRLNKQAQKNAIQQTVVASVSSRALSGANPVGQVPEPSRASTTSIRFQVEPQSEPPPLSPPPMEQRLPSPPPSLVSTGELERQLKESLDRLQKSASPKPLIVDAEESAAPELPKESNEPRPAKFDVPTLPPLPALDPVGAKKETGSAPPAPTPVTPPPPAPPSVEVNEKNFDIQRSRTPAAEASDALPPGVPAAEVPNVVPPPAPLPTPIVSTPMPAVETAKMSAAAREEFQKRLTELEMKFLKETVGELETRMRQMPAGDADRRRLELDHQRYHERLVRLTKIMERRSDLLEANYTTPAESPWMMTMETLDGKTVLQAMVHRRARFKVVCDRLDVQAPRGTLLAVGHVQISGEGFHGACDRLSIPLHDDRLILEGNAEVGIRAQHQALAEPKPEGIPPAIEERRATDKSGMPPLLHLRGEHLDLRWSDLQEISSLQEPADRQQLSTSINSDAGRTGTIRATPGPMVKVAYSADRSEQWSEWGTLRRTVQGRDGLTSFTLEDRQGKTIATIQPPPGLSLTEYCGRRVSVFGRVSRDEGRTVFHASHVAWE